MAKSDFWFHHVFRVRYSEVDAQAIVFFGNYLSYFDSAHNEYMRALSFDYLQHVEHHNYDIHIVKAVVDYHAPARFDDELEVYVRTSYIGRSSMKVCFEVCPAGKDTLITTAEFVVVNADRASMKSVPWPDAFVQEIIDREVIPVERP